MQNAGNWIWLVCSSLHKCLPGWKRWKLAMAITEEKPFVIYADTCRTCFWSTSNYIPIINCPGKWHGVGRMVDGFGLVWLGLARWLVDKIIRNFLIFNPKLKMRDDAQILRRTFARRCNHFSKTTLYNSYFFNQPKKICFNYNFKQFKWEIGRPGNSTFTWLLFKSTFCLLERATSYLSSIS